MINTASKANVLLVDDSKLVRMMVREIIESEPGLLVQAEAANGAEALECIQQQDPDLIVLDLEMPIMDGLTFLRYARVRSTAKVIVLSSVATIGSDNSRKAWLLGADAVISKPSGAISMDLVERRQTVLLAAARDLLGIGR